MLECSGIRIIDDLGLRQLRDDEPIDLYEIIRPLRAAINPDHLEPNRARDGRSLRDPLLASAAMDRLLHDAHVLILDGASFRNPPLERRRARKNHQPEAAT